MNGALLVNKPAGITSHTVIDKIRRRFAFKRVGHAGTLDPFATGLLVVLCNKATRLQSVFLNDTKGYEGVFLLGRSTDTHDITGAVLEDDFQCKYSDGTTLPELERHLESVFIGQLEQIPPVYSAIKVSGKRSYELARRGEVVEHTARSITIESISLRFLDKHRLSYKVLVSKGTYIRALARDMGQFLGVPACVESLRRTSIGPYLIDGAVDLAELLKSTDVDSVALSMEELVAHLPHLRPTNAECLALKNGNQSPLRNARLEETKYEGDLKDNVAAIVDETGRLCGLAQGDVGNGDESGKTHSWKLRFMM